jgi:3-deoxy-7-phosphoheptulonate synthase
MVVVMTADASASDVDHVMSVVRDAGGEAFVSRGESRTIIGLSGDIERFAATLNLAGLPGVANVVRISVPYKLVSREHRRERSVVRVAGVPIGPDTLTVIAGPCAVETPEQTLAAARMARAAGASLLRGGAFKPRSSPYAFQGLGETGLKILAEVREETGLPIVTEVIDQRDVELVTKYADMLQVGTRNMQNFPLLQAVGAAGKPVMLRPPSTSRSAATWTSCCASAASAPSRRPPAIRWTFRRCRWCSGCRTCRSSWTRRIPAAAATWCCRCRGPRSRSAPTASSSTSTRTRSPRSATAPKR